MSQGEEVGGASDGRQAVGFAQLAAENARLRQKLQTPPEQRIMAEVVARRLDAFLRGAAARVPGPDDAADAEGDGAVEGASDPPAHPTPSPRRVIVSEALAAVCAEKAALEKRLADVVGTVVAPLQETVVRLEQERAALEGRVAELEESAAGRSPPVFLAELAALRRSEAVYRDQLAAAQDDDAGAVRRCTAALSEGLAASRAMPDYARLVGEFREALRAARAAQTFLTLALEEQRARYALREEVATTVAVGERACLEERVALLEQRLREAEGREATRVGERQRLEGELRAVREENHRLRAQPSSSDGSAVDAHAAKRQRVEEEVAQGSHSASVRRDIVQFWYDGHDTIRALERKLAEMARLPGDLRVSQGRIVQLERSREATVAHLASVTQEVAKSRKENQQLRAHIVGLEVERDHLMQVVATTVGAHMSSDELKRCCEVIRESARKGAAASAAVVADPAAVQQAVRRAQELKSEVARMQRQRDKLTAFIAIQQQRLAAQLEGRVLTTVPAHGQGAAGAAAVVDTSDRPVALPQLLETVLSGAKDVLWESELAAVGLLDDRSALHEAMHRPRDDYVTLQARLHESQEKLLASQRRLQELASTSSAAKEAAERAMETLSSQAQSRDAAVRALEESNASLLRHTAALGAERRELRRQLTAAATFAERVLGALAGVFGLFQKEAAYVRELRAVIAGDRRDMMELVRGVGGGVVGDAGGRGEDAARPVIAALEHLSGGLQVHVDESRLASAAERTAYLQRLVTLLQQQESRLQAMQADFVEASKSQAASLAQHVMDAQREWEGAWRTRCLAAEAQREQLAALGLARTSLHRALEGAVARAPAAAPTAPGTTSEVGASADAGSASAAPTASETIRAIDHFIAQARLRLAACEAEARTELPPPPPASAEPPAATSEAVPPVAAEAVSDGPAPAETPVEGAEGSLE